MADEPSQQSPEFLRFLAKREQHLRQARNDINCFVEYCMTDAHGRPVMQGDIHREWQALGDRYRRLMILGSKQHGKSQQSLWRGMFKLGRDRNELIKIVCSSDRKGSKRMNTIRRNIEGNDDMHRVFPHLHPRCVRTINKKHLYLERPTDSPEPSVEAIGITSSATGDRATGLIVDDAVDQRNSVMQPKMRESIRNAWGDWYSLLSPDGWMFWISNLWHRCIPEDEPVVTNRGLLSIGELGDACLRVARDTYERPIAVSREWFDGELIEVAVEGQAHRYRFTPRHRLPTTDGLKRADELRAGHSLIQGCSEERDIPHRIRLVGPSRYTGWVYDVETSTGYFDLYGGITSHNSDLTHELMANEAYAVARYEVDLDTMEGLVTLPDGTFRRMPDGLWPEFWSVRKLKDQKRTLKPRAFARLYSLRPMNTTEVKVQPKWIRPWSSPPGEDWDRIMMLDLAESEEEGADMIGIAEAMVSPTSPKIKIVDTWHTKIDFDSKVTLLRDQHAEHHYSDIVLEKSAGGISLFQHLVRRYRMPVRLLPVGGKRKGLWLDEAIPYLKAGVVEWDPYLIENSGEMGDRGDGVAEILNFGSYPTDNILDSVTRLISYIITCYEIFDDVDLDTDGGDGAPVVSRDYDEDDFEVVLI